jgi:probable rRNA maturation factor
MPSYTATAATDRDEPGANSAGDSDPPSEPADPSEPPPAEAGPVTISVPDDASLGDVDRPWIADALTRAVEVLGRPVERVSVLLVDDARMIDLHRRYLDESGTTDVLTFPASEPGAPIEADIAVCVDVAAREAPARGHRLEQELLLYALHGVLHCAGYDDHDPEAFAAMHAEEDRILTAIGLGATFADDGPEGSP